MKNGHVPDFMRAAAGMDSRRPMLALAGPIPDALACGQTAVPTSFAWSTASRPDGQRFVVLQAATQTGVQMYSLGADVAKQVGEALIGMGRQVESDIVIVPGQS